MNLCYRIADRIHRHRARKALVGGHRRQKDESEYWTWQFQSSQKYFAKFFDLDARIKDAEVIDIGCGLGGRTCFLAKQGVRRIVGTDVNRGEIDRAVQLAGQSGDREIDRKVSFEWVTEEHQGSSQFDVALLVDSLEHVRDPVAFLSQAHSLLRPGGVCYFSTRGWYHYDASHVGSIIPIPFATLLFTDRQILDAVRKIVDQPYYQRTMWDSDPPSKRWQDCHSLHDRPGEYLNKYRISDFRKAMQASEFSRGQLKIQGPSANRHPLLAAFNFLTRIPVVREVYHVAIFGRLMKGASNRSSPDAETPRSLRISA